MNLGERGKKLIQAFEGCKLTAYIDGGGVLTVGWGHTGRDVTPGMAITQERADWLFDADIAVFEEAVNSLVKVSVTQNQFDALVSFSYNCGRDALKDSTLLRLLNEGEYVRAAAQLCRWNKDNGIVVKGLVRRRAAERLIFETP